MATETNLRYPIGEFAWSGANTPLDRERMIDLIAEIPAHYQKAVRGLTIDQLETRYRPEGWTLRQVVHHVPDSHMNAYVRFKLTLTEDSPLIKPYDESRWAELDDSRKTSVDVSLALLVSLHRRWANLMHAMKSSDWSRAYVHPEMGPVPLDKALALYAWHSQHHLAHITMTRKAKGW